MMQLFILLFNSFVWGLTAAILAFQNEWLEMRINIGFIIPAIMVISVLIYYLLIRNQMIKKSIDKKSSLVSFLICMVVIIFVLGFERMLIVPAAIIREAIHMTSINFASINIFLLLIMITGLTAIIFSKR